MERWENVKTLLAIFSIGAAAFAWIAANFTAWEMLAEDRTWWPLGAFMTGCILPLFGLAAWVDIKAHRKGRQS